MKKEIRRIRPHERNDVMPDVLRAIECVKNGDMVGVHSANKVGRVWSQSSGIAEYSVACLGNKDE